LRGGLHGGSGIEIISQFQKTLGGGGDKLVLAKF